MNNVKNESYAEPNMNVSEQKTITETEKTEYRSAIRLLPEVAKRFMWSNPNRWVKQITWLRDEDGVHVYEVEHYPNEGFQRRRSVLL
jgi:hypothetical protein